MFNRICSGSGEPHTHPKFLPGMSHGICSASREPHTHPKFLSGKSHGICSASRELHTHPKHREPQSQDVSPVVGGIPFSWELGIPAWSRGRAGQGGAEQGGAGRGRAGLTSGQLLKSPAVVYNPGEEVISP